MPISEQNQQKIKKEIQNIIKRAIVQFPNSVNEMLIFLSRAFHHIFDNDRRFVHKLDDAKMTAYFGDQQKLFSEINQACKQIYIETIKDLGQKQQREWFDLIETIVCESINKEFNPEFYSLTNSALQRKLNAKPEAMVNPRFWLTSFPFAGDLTRLPLHPKIQASMFYPLEIALLLQRWDLVLTILRTAEAKDINVMQPNKDLIYREDEFVAAYLQNNADNTALGFSSFAAALKLIEMQFKYPSGFVETDFPGVMAKSLNLMLAIMEKHKSTRNILTAPINFPGIFLQDSSANRNTCYQYIFANINIVLIEFVLKRLGQETLSSDLDFKFALLSCAVDNYCFEQLYSAPGMQFDYSSAGEKTKRIQLLQYLVNAQTSFFDDFLCFKNTPKLFAADEKSEVFLVLLEAAIECPNLHFVSNTFKLARNVDIDVSLDAYYKSLENSLNRSLLSQKLMQSRDFFEIIMLLLDYIPGDYFPVSLKTSLKQYLEVICNTGGLIQIKNFQESNRACLASLMKLMHSVNLELTETKQHNDFLWKCITSLLNFLDIQKTDSLQKNILDYAIEFNDPTMIKYLITRGALPNSNELVGCMDAANKSYSDFALKIKALSRMKQPQLKYALARNIIWKDDIKVTQEYLTNLTERLQLLGASKTRENHLHLLLLILAYCNHQNRHGLELAQAKDTVIASRTNYYSETDAETRRSIYTNLSKYSCNYAVSKGIKLFFNEHNKKVFLAKAFPKIHAENLLLQEQQGDDGKTCTTMVLDSNDLEI